MAVCGCFGYLISQIVSSQEIYKRGKQTTQTTQTAKSVAKTMQKQKYNLFQLRTKQPFRISNGKSHWFWFELPHNYHKTTEDKPSLPLIKLREILNDEVVIEFDDTDFAGTESEFKEFSKIAIIETSINLLNENIKFKVWSHKGKSPHLHIQNLPIQQLNGDERKIWKETFVLHYTPKKYHKFVDLSLCGIHLIAVEWTNHWKKKYSIKKLVFSIGTRGNND